MGDKGLLRLAEIDLKVARNILGITDELSVNIAAYHVQQFIEKWLKYNINLKGCKYSKTHVAAILISEAEAAGVQVPMFITDMSFSLDAWATQSRYNSDLLTTRRVVLSVIEKCETLLQTDTPLTSNMFHD